MIISGVCMGILIGLVAAPCSHNTPIVKTDTTSWDHLTLEPYDTTGGKRLRVEPKLTITDNTHAKVDSHTNIRKLFYEMECLDKSGVPNGIYIICGDTIYVQRIN